MKKVRWVIGLAALALIGLYVFIPGTMVIKSTGNLKVNARSFNRNISDETKWNRWWPSDSGKSTPTAPAGNFIFNGYAYRITEKNLTSVLLQINGSDKLLQTELFFLPIREDSIYLEWVATSLMPTNPIKRLTTFFENKAIKRDMEVIMNTLQSYYSKRENLYSISIKQDFVVDSLLISTTSTTTGYPSTQNVYKLIDKLKSFAKKKGASQSGFPMLHVTTEDSIIYFTRVALPLDRRLDNEGDIEFRWMLGGGDILVAQVRGGPNAVNNGFVEMENYVQDFRRTAPAIPFQSLITDRSKETDTAKWITRLNWPVM